VETGDQKLEKMPQCEGNKEGYTEKSTGDLREMGWQCRPIHKNECMMHHVFHDSKGKRGRKWGSLQIDQRDWGDSQREMAARTGEGPGTRGGGEGNKYSSRKSSL